MKEFKKKVLSVVLAVVLTLGTVMSVQATETDEVLNDAVLEDIIDALKEEKVSGGGMEGYVEGEAIVCVKESQMPYVRRNAAGQGLLAGAETLMTLENSTGEDAESGSGDDGEAGGGATVLYGAGSDEAVESLKLVKSDDLSTEELIDQLEELDQVVFAEPNYIYSAATTTSGDYTEQQWGYDTDEGYDINIPGWNDSDSSNAVDTSDTVVAVLDYGIDYNHEDLKDVMWTASPELQKKIGGGTYGYNAVSVKFNGDPYDPTDPMDDVSHGTLCAGIIAAEWNEYGISGATKGAKLMAVKIASDSRRIMTSNAIKGFEYVKRAKENGVNVTVTSNSWGGAACEMPAIDRAVTELGEIGVVSVFSSGNETSDCDTNSKSGAMLKNNPYAIVVNATDQNGNMASFSNYGAVTTDVAAPGVNILSTIPTSETDLYTLMPTKVQALATETFSDNTNTTGVIEGTLFDYTLLSDTTIVLDQSKNFPDSDSPGDGSLKITQSNPEASKINIKCNVRDLENCGYIALRYYGDMESENESVGASVSAFVIAIVAGKPIMSSGLLENWNQVVIPLPEGTASGNIDVTLLTGLIDLNAVTYGGSVYIDDIKLYGEDGYASVPYKYDMGTSVSAPAVAGEVAMVASKFAGEPADKWVARVIGSAKKIDSHKGKSVSEGIIDVQKALDEDYVPVLNSAEADENGTLTVKGYFFGKNKGTLTVSGQQVEVTSWSEEEIIAKVPEKLASGAHKVEVSTSDGKAGHQSFELALPGNLYERIALPEDEEFISLEQSTLTGLGGSLYLSGNNTAGELEIWRYTPEQTKNRGWTRVYHNEKLARDVDTACTWKDQLVFMIQEYDSKRVKYGDGMIGIFDPETGTLKTVKVSDDLDSMGEFSIINNGTDILLIGGNRYDKSGKATPQTAVYKLDVEKGTIDKLCDLHKARVNPAVAYTAEGDVYVAAGTDDGYVDGLERISPNGTVTMVRENVLPQEMVSEWQSGQDRKYSFATVDGGMMLTGPALYKDGAVTADVYTLDFDSGAFKKTDKIVSTSRLFEPVATTYQNVFYVLGNTINVLPFEKVFAVDRSVKTIAQPGDSYVPPSSQQQDILDEKPAAPTEKPDIVTSTKEQDKDTFTKELGKGDGIDTGDRNDMILWLCILITSFLILIIYGCQRKNWKKTE